MVSRKAATERIFSEEPLHDVWMRLLNFSYEENLRAFKAVRTGEDLAPDTRADIASSLQQAREYFRAAEAVSLHTSPLQIYYGTVSLLRATVLLLWGRCDPIESHGMSVPAADNKARIGEVALVTRAASGGALGAYVKALLPGQALVGNEEWSLAQLLGSVPDVYDLHVASYVGRKDLHLIPIERVLSDAGHNFDRCSQKEVPNASELLKRVPALAVQYLQPQQVGEFVIFRPRLTATVDISVEALSGRRFLPVSHVMKTREVTLSEGIYMFMALFTLGMLSRYHPRRWGQVVSAPDLAERQLVEQFLRVARRKLPNIALNLIVNRPLVFTPARVEGTDLRQFVRRDEVKEMIAEAVSRFARGGQE